jgi:hypothetical protein
MRPCLSANILNPLTRTSVITGNPEYRALKSDCIDCPLKAKCCPKSETRAIHREKYEIVREFSRQCTASNFNQIASDRRKKVAMLFAHLKRILGLARLKLRGPYGVQDEFTLANNRPIPPETRKTQANGISRRVKSRLATNRQMKST